MAQQLRARLCDKYPEIDWVYSDAYLQKVLDVPGRTFEYACDEKVTGALQWRREFGVDELCNELHNSNGEWVQNSLRSGFVHVDTRRMCISNSLVWGSGEAPVLWCVVGELDWANPIAIMQHHVCVIEHGIRTVLPLSSTECLRVVVDVSHIGLSNLPTLEVMRGLVALLQKAYPERVESFALHQWV